MSEPTLSAAPAGRPGAPALIAADGTVTTYAGLSDRIAALAAWLRGFLGPRQVAAVIAGNGPAAVPVIAAAATACVCAPLPPGRGVDERVAELSRLGAGVLLIAEANDADESAARRLGVPAVRLSGPLPGLPPLDSPQCTVDAALLVHTSGSTGAGKLVPLTTAALVHAASLVAGTLGLSPADRCLNVLPLHHTHGLVGAVLSTLISGGSVVCLPEYTDEGLATALLDLEPTWYTAVPAIHTRVAAFAEAGRLAGHHLRFARSASAPLHEPVRRRLASALGIPVVQAYALTEAPGQICAQAPTDPVVPGSVGRPAGCDVTVSADGDILVRGPHVSPGYLSAVDSPLRPHEDGLLHTGDLGHLAPTGDLILAGRRDDIINRAGEKLVPEQIEAALTAHPAVTDAVVAGIPDPVLGQATVAIVTGLVDQDAVRRHVAHTLSPAHVPDRVILLLSDRIPRSPTGKVNRRALATRLATPDPAPPAPDVGSAVATICSHVLLLPTIDPDTPLAALGATSLHTARIETLITERFGVHLPPAALLDPTLTPRTLTTLIRDALTPGAGPWEDGAHVRRGRAAAGTGPRTAPGADRRGAGGGLR